MNRSRAVPIHRRIRAFLPIASAAIVLALLLPDAAAAQKQFYQLYDEGLEYKERGDWQRALAAFKAAYSLEPQDTKRKRTYGTRFIKYYPHREAGICYFHLEEYGRARRELQLSMRFHRTEDAERVLKQVEELLAAGGDEGGVDEILELTAASTEAEQELLRVQQEELERQRRELEEERERLEAEAASKAAEEAAEMRRAIADREREMEKQRRALEAEQRRAEETQLRLAEERRRLREGNPTMPLLSGQLTYDAEAVVQVGERLSVAVLDFEFSGDEGAELFAQQIPERLVTQLVSFRRFTVIEREKLRDIVQEQKLSMTGLVGAQAQEMGQMIGSDVITVGSVNVVGGLTEIQGRMLDVETGEVLAAHSVQAQNVDGERLAALITELAIHFHNELPLAEGKVLRADYENEVLYLSLGVAAKVRKGTKMVAYEEGEPIVDEDTGEIYGIPRQLLGEVVVTQVQERMSTAIVVEGDMELMEAGRVVIK